MLRHLWLIAGTVLAVTIVATTATATTNVARSAHAADATPAAAPFAQSWATVPRTTAARQARDIVVFGQEQDIVGFNTALTCCNQFWAGIQTIPVIRGAFLVERQAPERQGPGLRREGDEDDAVVHDPAGRELELGRQEDPGHVQGLRLHVAADRRPEERPRTAVTATTRSPASPTRAEADHVQVEEAVRRLADPVRRHLSVGSTRGDGLQQDLDELHLRQRRQARLERPVPADQLHEGPGLDAEGQPLLVRQEAGHQRDRLQDHHRHEHRGSGHARRRGRRDQPDLRSQPAPAEDDARHHLHPGARPLAGAHRHPVRQAGPAPPSLAVDAPGAHDGHRPQVDHQDRLR